MTSTQNTPRPAYGPYSIEFKAFEGALLAANENDTQDQLISAGIAAAIAAHEAAAGRG